MRNVTRRLRFRLWLGLKLIALGARITGMRIKIEPIEIVDDPGYEDELKR